MHAQPYNPQRSSSSPSDAVAHRQAVPLRYALCCPLRCFCCLGDAVPYFLPRYSVQSLSLVRVHLPTRLAHAGGAAAAQAAAHAGHTAGAAPKHPAGDLGPAAPLLQQQVPAAAAGQVGERASWCKWAGADCEGWAGGAGRRQRCAAGRGGAEAGPEVPQADSSLQQQQQQWSACGSCMQQRPCRFCCDVGTPVRISQVCTQLAGRIYGCGSLTAAPASRTRCKARSSSNLQRLLAYTADDGRPNIVQWRQQSSRGGWARLLPQQHTGVSVR